ncbi:MAG: hypothetical protein ABIV21_01530, partial [Pyrinomonadaceae bacterium]
SGSILGKAMQALTTVESSADAHSDDAAILGPLHYGEPARMYAVPLVARGRSVAVLYADHGSEGGNVNIEALETLVRVAGLTVELLASATQAGQAEKTVPADLEDAGHEASNETAHREFVREQETELSKETSSSFDEYEMPAQTAYDEAPAETVEMADEVDTTGFAFSEPEPIDPAEDADGQFSETAAASAPVEEFAFPEAAEYPVTNGEVVDDYSFQQFDSEPFESEAPPETAEIDGAVTSFDPVSNISSPFDQSVDEYEPAALQSSGGFAQIAEQVVEAPVAAKPHTRLSDRPVDLPIEVPDEERRIHNDARRFARLLVSEIKLYNEKKVTEGRESQDLYERLREAIERSREMYDKRVQPPVAAKFDYFHYEIVNSLADGEISRLGSNYPGSSV